MSSRVILTSAIIVTLTLISGLLHGKLTLRWAAPDSSNVQPLVDVPTKIGEWEMVEEHEIADSVVYALRATDWIHRTYSNTKTGERVNMAIVAGPHGPVSVHRPEICYSSQKYQQFKPREKIVVSGEGANASNEFWALTMRANDVHASPLSVLYAWSGGGPWEAPKSARRDLAGHSRLVKLQISSALPGSITDESSPNACVDFLKEFCRSVGPLISS